MPGIARFLRKLHFEIPEFEFFVNMLNNMIKERKMTNIVSPELLKANSSVFKP